MWAISVSNYNRSQAVFLIDNEQLLLLASQLLNIQYYIGVPMPLYMYCTDMVCMVVNATTCRWTKSCVLIVLAYHNVCSSLIYPVCMYILLTALDKQASCNHREDSPVYCSDGAPDRDHD